MSKTSHPIWRLLPSMDKQERFIRQLRFASTSEVAAAITRLLFILDKKPNTAVLHIVQADNRIDISLLQQDIDSGLQKEIDDLFE